MIGKTELENRSGAKETYYCITIGDGDANIFFFTQSAENYRAANEFSKGY